MDTDFLARESEFLARNPLHIFFKMDDTVSVL